MQNVVISTVREKDTNVVERENSGGRGDGNLCLHATLQGTALAEMIARVT